MIDNLHANKVIDEEPPDEYTDLLEIANWLNRYLDVPNTRILQALCLDSTDRVLDWVTPHLFPEKYGSLYIVILDFVTSWGPSEEYRSFICNLPSPCGVYISANESSVGFASLEMLLIKDGERREIQIDPKYNYYAPSWHRRKINIEAFYAQAYEEITGESAPLNSYYFENIARTNNVEELIEATNKYSKQLEKSSDRWRYPINLNRVLQKKAYKTLAWVLCNDCLYISLSDWSTPRALSTCCRNNDIETAYAILGNIEMDEKETKRAVRMISKQDQNDACKYVLTWLERNDS